MNHMKTQSEVFGRECWYSIEKLAPCEDTCPLHVDVPSYVLAIALAKYEEATNIIRKSIALPSVCARVCHHPCEDACLRAKVDEPIAIKALKRFATDYELGCGLAKPARIEPFRREKVAIIGSGPTGLTAALEILKRGYSSTVFEGESIAGGMLALGVPEFILPKKVLQNDIEYLKGLGVEIKTNVALGKDLILEDLWHQGYKAVLLAIGSQRPVGLDIPGMKLKGVFHALTLLKEVNLGKRIKLNGKVVIIGGGNVGVAVGRAASRLGATEVNLTCLESRKDMPAFEWEIERAQEEGVKIHTSLAPLGIVARDGKAATVNLVHVESIEFDNQGRMKPVIDVSDRHDMEADAVIVAIGQAPDLAFNSVQKLKVEGKGTIAVEPDSLATSIAGVFAAGDAVTGVGTVVEAMAAGKKAAQSIDRYIANLEPVKAEAPVVVGVTDQRIPKFVEVRRRQSVPLLSGARRVSSFEEVELGFSEEPAVAEAKRCLNCPICGNCIFIRSQMCHETATRLL